jgi:3-dehydroquinate dehydratase-2
VCAAHVAGTGAEAYLEALERLSRAASRAAAARTTKSLGRAPGRDGKAPVRTAPVTPAPVTRPAARVTAPATSTPQPAAARAGKTLGPVRDSAPASTARGAEATPVRAEARAAGFGKTLGRAAPEAPSGTRRPGAGLTRAEVRSRIAERLSGRLTPAGLATWARGEWVALQRGAAVEAGQRDQLEEVLQALFLSAQPRGALSDHQLVEWMAALE